MPVIVIAANEVSFDVQGQGDRAMLFVHGIGADFTVWKPLVDHFSSNFKCYRFDWKGFGESRLNVDSGFAPGILAKELKAIVEELNIKSDFFIVADNLGALAALQADIDDLIRCNGIIAINIADKAKLKAKYKQLYKGVLDNTRLKMVEKMGLKEQFEKRQSIIEGWLKEVSSVDMSSDTQYIETPVDFILGKENSFVSLKDCEGSVGRISRSRVVQVDGGDFIMLENPAAVIKEIESFIGQYIPSLAKKT
ncbi:MAG: alpha/beta hydrolase [Candidatus Lokiarchaeota archaeon]|nr:alpha/beta hydrolase [Candidatus Lokiarchaeota archaeon]